jgi:hypothetical protein
MTILRLFNIQGIAGLAASVCLALLLVLQKGETRHWKKESSQYEQLYANEHAAFAGTAANYRAAAEAARASDAANAQRVFAEQQSISQRSSNDYETRIAAARSLAQRLREQAAASPSHPGAGGAAPVSGLSVASRRAAEGAGEDRLPETDALTATEQAIQLDELVKWVREQAKVDNNAVAGASSKP